MNYLGTPLEAWAIFFAIIFFLMIVDLGVFNRRPKKPSMGIAVAWTGFYVMLAMLFGLAVPTLTGRGPESMMEYYTAFALEKTLSFDNIFVMALIFQHLCIPEQYQHRVLFWGLLGVIVLRGLFISAGALLVSSFSWLLLIFGAFLLYTGFKLMFAGDKGPADPRNSKVLRFLNKHFRVSYMQMSDGFLHKDSDGLYWLNPILVALIMIECTDVLFAVDSIPAAFAVTQDAFVLFTSNLFAVMGLRALYFVLLAMLDRFKYLAGALSIVLAFIGGKIILQEGLHYRIEAGTSLLIVIGLLGGGIVASLFCTKGSKNGTA